MMLSNETMGPRGSCGSGQFEVILSSETLVEGPGGRDMLE